VGTAATAGTAAASVDAVVAAMAASATASFGPVFVSLLTLRLRGVLIYAHICIGSLAPKVLGSLAFKACKVPWLSRLYDSYIYTRQPALLELCNLP
jgi:hypothetical protein